MKIMQWLDQEMDGHFSIMNFSYVELTSSFTVMVCNLLSSKKEPVEISRQALFYTPIPCPPNPHRQPLASDCGSTRKNPPAAALFPIMRHFAPSGPDLPYRRWRLLRPACLR